MPDPGAHVGLGRAPRPREITPSSFGGALGKLWAAVAGDNRQEERDRVKAERGHRLLKLLQREAPADIWDDIWAMFVEQFDEQLELVMDGEAPHETLIALRNWAAKFDEKLALGAKAMQRLAEKRTVLVQAAAGAKAEAAGERSG